MINKNSNRLLTYIINITNRLKFIDDCMASIGGLILIWKFLKDITFSVE